MRAPQVVREEKRIREEEEAKAAAGRREMQRAMMEEEKRQREDRAIAVIQRSMRLAMQRKRAWKHWQVCSRRGVGGCACKVQGECAARAV